MQGWPGGETERRIRTLRRGNEYHSRGRRKNHNRTQSSDRKAAFSPSPLPTPPARNRGSTSPTKLTLINSVSTTTSLPRQPHPARAIAWLRSLFYFFYPSSPPPSAAPGRGNILVLVIIVVVIVVAGSEGRTDSFLFPGLY